MEERSVREGRRDGSSQRGRRRGDQNGEGGKDQNGEGGGIDHVGEGGRRREGSSRRGRGRDESSRREEDVNLLKGEQHDAPAMWQKQIYRVTGTK
jgi:hypothetical protein